MRRAVALPGHVGQVLHLARLHPRGKPVEQQLLLAILETSLQH